MAQTESEQRASDVRALEFALAGAEKTRDAADADVARLKDELEQARQRCDPFGSEAFRRAADDYAHHRVGASRDGAFAKLQAFCREAAARQQVATPGRELAAGEEAGESPGRKLAEKAITLVGKSDDGEPIVQFRAAMVPDGILFCPPRDRYGETRRLAEVRTVVAALIDTAVSAALAAERAAGGELPPQLEVAQDAAIRLNREDREKFAAWFREWCVGVLGDGAATGELPAGLEEPETVAEGLFNSPDNRAKVADALSTRDRWHAADKQKAVAETVNAVLDEINRSVIEQRDRDVKDIGVNVDVANHNAMQRLRTMLSKHRKD